MSSRRAGGLRPRRGVWLHVRTLVSWQTDSCRSGFDGWLLWTWDAASEQPEWWNALDAGGAIADALSPALRPDPCSIGGLDLG